MDNLKMHTPNLADENYKKLAALFPNAVTEVIVGYEPEMDENGQEKVGYDGKPIMKPIIERAIDKDVLMQEISARVVEGREERYQFTWPDKKKAILAANAPIAATLRPVKGDSVGRDGTPGGWDSENLYIEGDNLDVLKLLQETYLGKVKMIYIDPPYNTGNDFVYEDDFAEDANSYLERSGQFDDQGNRLEQNTESNGRFHTDWLNMIYPRLKLAKNLLTDDGVIFISIDDAEVENLCKICDEVFGEKNFYAQIVWQKRTSPDARYNLGAAHDFILVYARNAELLKTTLNKEPFSEDRTSAFKNPDNDPRGPWASVDITGQTGHATASQYYEITTPSGVKMRPPTGRCWALAESTFLSLVADGRIWFGEDGSSRPRQKRFLSEAGGGNAWTWWDNETVGHNQEASKILKDLLGSADIFTNPKPVRLLKRMIALSTKPDEIILDFFSGSATTAHAVMHLNVDDGGHRKFIMVQLPELTDEKSEAYKAGYKNICEIGKERIRRAGRKIKDEAGMTAQDLDIGFRVLRLDSSNMQDVYYNPAELKQEQVDWLSDNIKPDRTPEDLLFQVMLDLGVELSSPIQETIIDGKKVFDVANGFLLACFDAGVTTETVTAIAKKKPFYAVFRDSSMVNDSVATNFDQIFETYSPGTVRRVL